MAVAGLVGTVELQTWFMVNIKMKGNMNKKKTMHTIRSMFFDLKNDKDNMDDFANIAYDAGYMVALCIALNRKRVANKIYDYFLKGW